MPKKKIASPMPSSTRLSLNIRLRSGNLNTLGPGKIALLQSIAECGSITAAAKGLGMSYRRAWLLVDGLNNSFRQPLVEANRGGLNGGGAALTEVGEQVLDLFRALEAKANKASQDERRAIERMMTQSR